MAQHAPSSAHPLDLTPAQEQHFFFFFSKRDIVKRMLRNLQGMFVRAREFENGLAVAAVLHEGESAKEQAPQPSNFTADAGQGTSMQERRRSKARWH